MNPKDYFIIRPTNEENNEFIITIGKHLATEKRFKTKRTAQLYINRPNWDTITALINEIIEINEELKKEEK